MTVTTTAPVEAVFTNGTGHVLRRCAGLPKYSVPAHMAPLAEFSRHAISPDGLNRCCRTCRHLWRQAHYHGRLPVPPTAPTPALRALQPLPVALPQPHAGLAALRRLAARLLRQLAAALEPPMA